MRVVLVDDEELARAVLREMLASDPRVEIVAECANGFEAVRAISLHRPDLVLLDIQMPKLDGFEVFELMEHKIPVVFVTAHDEYALRAFEVHAADYLLKPFTAERLRLAMDRALVHRAPDAAALASEVRRLSDAGPLERVVVRDGTKVTIIPVAKLDFAEAQDDYVSLASEGKRYLKQQTIAGLEVALDPAQFVRIHRSWLVRLDRVARIEPAGKDSMLVVLHSGERLPVSRSGHARLKQALGA
ncbi:MAG: LytR/AlgR family response regulator transcription factor [Terriglobales bacterium]